MQFIVEIVAFADNEVVKRFAPTSSKRQAERVEGGVEINLDHEHYFTRIVEEDK